MTLPIEKADSGQLYGRALAEMISDAMAERAFTCCAASILRPGAPPIRLFSGIMNPEEAAGGVEPAPIRREVLFDLASLTKPLATTILALIALDRGGLRLDDEAVKFLPEARGLRNGASLRDLLRHSAGLPAIPALQAAFPDPSRTDRDKAIARLCAIEAVGRPGKVVEYSCTGFLLLGLILERIGGRRLASLFRDEVASPLGLDGREGRGLATFCPPEPLHATCVPTEICPWRKTRVRGAVHDESSYCLGGDGGNAGLFADLAAAERLFTVFSDGGGILPEALAHEARLLQTAGMGEPRGLGFQLSFIVGKIDSYGHTGFTGTSIGGFGLDSEPRDSVLGILLANRVYYGREDTLEKIRSLRSSFYGSMAKAFDGLNRGSGHGNAIE
jgi:CubicO group peptidase (beta-lactamase class C family)